MLEKEGLGGKSIEFFQFTSGTEVINAMASGSIDISLNGSSPTAAGYSRGVDLQVIYIYDNINDAEALVVDDTVTAPQDLMGKTIAVPFGSTTHCRPTWSRPGREAISPAASSGTRRWAG
jgi:taurine transport system substrate-binding protein